MGAAVLVGWGFKIGAEVSSVYVSAPEEVRVIVFGEPLNAWAQSEGLLRDTVNKGGATTSAFTTALLVQL